jgi:hypothetical protein
MIAERHVGRDVRREIADFLQISLDGAFKWKPGDAAVGVLHFSRTIPLDGKLVRRNFLDNFGDLSARRRLVARSNLSRSSRFGKMRGGKTLLTIGSETWKRRCAGSTPLSFITLNTK